MRGFNSRTALGVSGVALCAGVALILGFTSASGHSRCESRGPVRLHGTPRSISPCARSAKLRRAVATMEAERRRLASAPMRAQRAASQMAFHDLSPRASKSLLLRDFGSRVRGANPAETVAQAGKAVHYILPAEKVIA